MSDNKNLVLSPGTVINSGERKYRIRESLGQGGFGITYLAVGEVVIHNVPCEAKFAIKEHFPSEFCFRAGQAVFAKPDKEQEYADSKADFISEAKKLHALGSENCNIVKVNEVFEANGSAYYVMQYINGDSLLHYVAQKKRLNWDEALTLMTPIINAVDFLHRSRINHLDIKPENIMLHEGMDGKVPVLIDFGLSIHFKKSGGKTSPKGVMGVSEGYSPLEQYAGIKDFTPEADIYSLMATMMFMLTGLQPKSASELRADDVRQQLAGKVPSEMIDAVCHALKKSLDDRTHSIAELKEELGIFDFKGKKTESLQSMQSSGDSGNVLGRIPKGVLMGCAAGLGVVLLALLMTKVGGCSGSGGSELIDSVTPHEVTDSLKHDSIAEPEPEPVMTQPTDNKQGRENDDSKKNESTVKPDPQPQSIQTPTPPKQDPQPTTGSLSLGYATWTGGIRKGKPDGHGRLVFHSAHAVDRHSSVMANAGDYFVATYDAGDLISGRLYDSDGNLLTTVIP